MALANDLLVGCSVEDASERSIIRPDPGYDSDGPSSVSTSSVMHFGIQMKRKQIEL